MDLEQFKRQTILERLEIGAKYGKVFSFIDFANVNNWFQDDNQDWNNRPLEQNQRLEIDIDKLKVFSDLIGQKTCLYYGQDPMNERSGKFTDALRVVFDSRNVVTKDLQKIKHTLRPDEDSVKYEKIDATGQRFVEIRKCNFDVEISVDAIKMMAHFDTFCIFSGDADFVYLNNFLRKKGKKVIIIKGGHITTKLRVSADLVLNAQQIKKEICRVKTKT